MIRRLIFVTLLLTAHTLGQNVSKETTTTETPTTTTSQKTTTMNTTPTSKQTTTTSPKTTIPTSTTTIAPSPPAPTPAPADNFPKNVGNWNVTDAETNVTCILLKGAIEVELSVADHDNKTIKYDVSIPKLAGANGKCGEILQDITLTWVSDIHAPIQSNELTFSFLKTINTTKANETIVGYQLEKISGSVYPHNFTNPIKFNLDDLHIHHLSANKSYKCNTEETLKSKTTMEAEVKVANVQMEAFRKSTDGKYSVPDECAADGYVADIVPIAVGCSLAGLVVIVLIAYLFGRRRARARGYQSV